ncbi:YecA family protein [Bacillus sp. FJAT-45037]|uniref:YecA family protein n=1 Tax=Bacillus sp. FJAT-45037 TaxID=2011007 RepID=UPI0012FD1CF5|nr:SEC-C metal-binding domain-containing protein [Bacillus sp. FJAT-45037]
MSQTTDQERVLAAMEELTALSAVQKRKRKSFFDNLSVPFTLKEGLSSLTKAELDSIRKRLDIKRASTLNKTNLIELFMKEIPERAESVYSIWDHERFNLLEKMLKNGGQVSIGELEFEQIEYLRATGFIFTATYNNQHVLALPKEFMEQLQFLRQDDDVWSTIRQNTEWTKLTHGLLYFYGVLTPDELFKLVEKYTEGVDCRSSFNKVIFDAMDYHEEFHVDKNGFSHYRVIDSDQVVQEQRMRESLNLYPFTKAQLIEAGSPDYVDRNKSYRQFVTFLKKEYHLEQEDADILAADCVDGVNMGHLPQELLEYLQTDIEIESLESLQKVMDNLIHLMNNTRQCFLKGYTPSELAAEEKKSMRPLPTQTGNVIDFQSRQKVGRNDPCPCGSGKKFKKCCGN